MGTPLREAIHAIAGGPREGRTIKAVLPGVSNPVITADQLDTPLTYEDMQAIGSGLGSAGFLVFDDTADMAAVAAGVARFLAVESCGQCTPCKQDGVALAAELELLCRDDGTKADLAKIRSLASTVGDRARCYLGTQQQVVIESILDALRRRARRPTCPAPRRRRSSRVLVAELVDITERARCSTSATPDKQPDWTFDATDSKQAPADRYGEHRRQQPWPGLSAAGSSPRSSSRAAGSAWRTRWRPGPTTTWVVRRRRRLRDGRPRDGPRARPHEHAARRSAARRVLPAGLRRAAGADRARSGTAFAAFRATSVVLLAVLFPLVWVLPASARCGAGALARRPRAARAQPGARHVRDDDHGRAAVPRGADAHPARLRPLGGGALAW